MNDNDKPDWKDAPGWANYLAMDGNGQWYWYELAPLDGYQAWDSGGGGHCQPVRPITGNWRDTLERRPEAA